MQISATVLLFDISVHANPPVKLSKFKKRGLRIILDDCTSDYETHLEKGKTLVMNGKRMTILSTEIFKTINNLNPSFMKVPFLLKCIMQPNMEQKVLQL